MFSINSENPTIWALGIGGLLVGSLIPDIDHGNSYISKKLKPLSRITSKLFKHRGPTHSLLGSGLMIGLLYYFLKILGLGKIYLEVIIKGFSLGIVSHIVLDMLTPAGISIFYPLWNKKLHLTTGQIKDYSNLKKQEKILSLVLIIVAFFLNVVMS